MNVLLELNKVSNAVVSPKMSKYTVNFLKHYFKFIFVVISWNQMIGLRESKMGIKVFLD